MPDERPRQIVHVGPDPTIIGGVATVVRGYLASPSGRYHHTSLAAYVPGTLSARVRTFAAACFLLRLRSPRSTWALHVHVTQGGDLIRAAVVSGIARRTGIPVVMTVHGSRFPAAAAKHPRVVARLLRGATAITCLSTETRLALTRLRGAPPIHVRNAVAPPTRAPQPEPGLVVFAGEVGLRKGVDVLLAAWPLVTQAAPTARLVLAGPTTDDDLIRDLPPHAEYAGAIDHDALCALLDRAWLVVLPSRAEALPMTLLEGMARGVPFVSTDVGDISSLAAGGVIVATADSEALATAIAGLVTNHAERGRLGIAARDLVTSDYSRRVVDAQMYEVYDLLRDVDA